MSLMKADVCCALTKKTKTRKVLKRVKTNEQEVRKIILATLPKFWLLVICSFIFALIIQAVGLIPPILMRNVVDIYIPNKDLRSAILSILFFVLIPVITTIFSTVYNYITTVAGRRMGQHLIMVSFEKLMYQPIDYFENNNSAEIASYCKTEAMNYVVFWIYDIPTLFAGICAGIAVFIIIANANLFIALGLLLYIPLSIIPSRFFARIIENYVKKIVENNAKSAQLIVDTFRGIKFVKSMLLEAKLSEKMKEYNDSTVKVWSKTAVIDNLNGSWTNDFLDSVFIGVIFSISVILIIRNQLTMGTLLLLLTLLPRFFAVMKSVSNANFNFRKQLAEYDKFFELIAMEDERNIESPNIEFSFVESIRFVNVDYSYGNDRGSVLNRLNLVIPRNKWTGIVGRSGSGKTTSLDLLLKFYNGYSGSILIDGVDITNISTESIRKNITKISQETFLFPVSLKENLLLVKPDATESELMRAVNDAGLIDFINSLPEKLETYVGEGGVQLSGGQLQRICLAQGLLRESKILLLDEVTSNIDTQVESEIKENIANLMKTRDLTVVSISHRSSFLDESDLIYVIEGGKVTECKKLPKYERLKQ